MHSMASQNPPSSSHADSQFGVNSWGRELFQISSTGTMLATAAPDAHIDLHEVTLGLRERGIRTPVLVRLPDLLKRKLADIRAAFDAAIAENQYQGRYTCIYPIKVNQNRVACEQVRDMAAPLGFGLEAGSKPELLAVLGMTADYPQMPIICNGFKDEPFLKTIVLAAKLGRKITPVIERPSELDATIELAQRYDVRPRIGIRYKPSSEGVGKWSSSAGMRSKFGLHATDLLAAIAKLRAAGMLDCLTMLHFHLGSQLCDIRQIKTAVAELAHLYVQLRTMGAPIMTLDVGGGLGIDYDGSASSTESSMNYSLREYAEDIVYRVKGVCDEAGQPHPEIMSESGRAIVAESSVLIVDVLGHTKFEAKLDLTTIREELAKDTPQPILDLIDTCERLDRTPPIESFHDAQQAREQAIALFGLGFLSLEQRSLADQLFWVIGRGALSAIPHDELPEDLAEVPELLSDIYYCNFSIFQSLPDSWAIGQLFPICPIHRLNEAPDRTGIIADITCDSDGEIDHFPTPKTAPAETTIPLHSLREGEPYFLGVFLVGAYQEVLGDLHNLFGDTHAVHVSADGSGGWTIDDYIEGDTVRDVLGYVQFDAETLKRAMRRSVELATRAGELTITEGRTLMNFYERGLDGYTYLE
ncbi:MAG: biosynthetic arginine decarboxylase [bacterium]|nr:biosynthetic arginine decarboxylase [bacterium]